jgi:hypothetical protein
MLAEMLIAFRLFELVFVRVPAAVIFCGPVGCVLADLRLSGCGTVHRCCGACRVDRRA